MESLLQEGHKVNWMSTETSYQTDYWYAGIKLWRQAETVGFDEIRRTKNESDLVETFKIVNGKYDVTPELFFQLDESGRRGHDQKLFKKRFRLDVRKYVF